MKEFLPGLFLLWEGHGIRTSAGKGSRLNGCTGTEPGICIPPWIEGSSGLLDLPWFGYAILWLGCAVTAIVHSPPLSHAGWVSDKLGPFVNEGFVLDVT